ncbi:MmcQ/YjbR family DNA-binding protein [Propionibacteriaceae bacterium Y2011]
MPIVVMIEDFVRLVGQLPEVQRRDTSHWSSFRVGGHVFGYLWERTETVGLKQPLAEQLALVAERPDVFEVQFTAGQFGWVVVTLAGIETDELAELVFEAWRLTAPAELVTDRGELLPS